MKWIALDLPDQQEATAAWLEATVLSNQLKGVIAELIAVHGDRSGNTVLEILGDRASAVLQRGLRAATPTMIGELLRQPTRLWDLQEWILQEGGSYWDQLLASKDIRRAVERTRRHLGEPLVPLVTLPARPRGRGRIFAHLVTSLVTATAVFLAVNVSRPVPEVPWGWGAPGALADGDRREYLVRLATRAEDWFAVRPTTRVDALRRIHEYRANCSALLVAEHPPLPAADRDWLRQRCRLWATKIDAAAVALEDDRAPAEVVALIDATTRQLVQALRERAGM